MDLENLCLRRDVDSKIRGFLFVQRLFLCFLKSNRISHVRCSQQQSESNLKDLVTQQNTIAYSRALYTYTDKNYKKNWVNDRKKVE